MWIYKREIELIFLHITGIWIYFAGGTQQRRNVSKSGTAEVETPKPKVRQSRRQKRRER